MEKRLKDVSNSFLRQECMAGSWSGSLQYSWFDTFQTHYFLFGTLNFLHIEGSTVAKLENRKLLVTEYSF